MNKRLTPEELKAKINILLSAKNDQEKQLKKAEEYGNYFDYLRIQSVINKISVEVEELRLELKAYDRITLQSLMPKEGPVHDQIIRQLIEISLASDYLMQTIEDFRSILSKLDIESADIFKEVKELSTRSNKVASRLLTDKSEYLSNLLLEDEELLHSISELTQNYIKSKTNL